MIQVIHLTNFQAHKDTRLDLHPGVNAIIGPSDVGKSAILRGMRWVIENQPSGDAFLRHGEKHVTAGVTIDDREIIRDKGKKNRYVLLDKDDKGDTSEEFVAMGKGKVPEEITALVNIQPDVNCQWQHDTPFLLGKDWTPGEVARTLNRAVNLEVIDSAMSRTTSMHLKTTQTKNTLTTELVRVETGLGELVGLDELDGQVAALEEAGQALRAKGFEFGALAGFMDSLTNTSNQLAALPQIPLDAEQQRTRLVNRITRHEDLRADHRGLGRLLHDIGAVGVQLNELPVTDHQEEGYDKIKYALMELDTKQDVFNELEALLQDIEILDHKRVDAEMDLTTAREQFSTLMPDECPLCGAEVE